MIDRYPFYNPQELRCRLMLESFRLGTVPRGRVEEFTFGRDVEIAIIKKWLANKNIGNLVIRGSYGSGKSHLLETVYEMAINNGYAAAMTTLEPNEAPPSKPKAVFAELMHSLKYLKDGKMHAIRDFLIEFKHIAYANKSEYQGWMSNALNFIETSGEQYFWNWLDGLGYLYPEMYNHGTAANIYCNILSGLSWIAVNILKIKGLVIVMDEAENVDNWYYQQYRINKGYNFLVGLAHVANNTPALLNERLMRDNSRHSTGTLFGEKTDLIYHGVESMRYCERMPSHLKITFAFTTEYGEIGIFKGTRIPFQDILLDKLSEKALEEAFNHISLLYCTGYNFQTATKDLSRGFEIVKTKASSSNRQFIKGSVEYQDIRRFNPSLNIDKIS